MTTLHCLLTIPAIIIKHQELTMFIFEWMAHQPVNEPLIESVMKDLSGNSGMSFLSTGRVIREIHQ